MLNRVKTPTKKLPWFGLSLLVLVLDQLSKAWASDTLTFGIPETFLPYFNFTLLHNYGAAFSFLANAGGWQSWLFGIVAFVVSVFLILWILSVELSKKYELAGLSLILGGAIGNLWDRISLGYVVDFIDWFYVAPSESCLFFFYSRASNGVVETCHWPAFNIADAAILLGAALLIIDMLLSSERKSLDSDS